VNIGGLLRAYVQLEGLRSNPLFHSFYSTPVQYSDTTRLVSGSSIRASNYLIMGGFPVIFPTHEHSHRCREPWTNPIPATPSTTLLTRKRKDGESSSHITL